MEFVRKNSALPVCALLILCFGTSFFQLFLRENVKDTNLVYCPLQKAWVRQNLPQPKIFKDFSDFCATDKRKDFFKLEISLKKGAFQPISEKLIFDYLAKDARALSSFGDLPNLPKPHLAGKAKFQMVTSGFSQDFGKQNLAAFTLPQSARPPTEALPVRFEFQFVFSLKQISRNINPRSPPSILS